eukprot:117654_1
MMYPGYDLFLPHSECGILYKTTLNATEIPTKRYRPQTRKKHTISCGITIHRNGKTIDVFSYYRSPDAGDYKDIFNIESHSDGLILGGDINLHHPHWGSTSQSSDSNDCVDLIHEAQWKVINDGSPTRFNVTNGKESNIDITIISNNLSHRDWKAIPDRSNTKSDHYPIIYTINTIDSYGYDVKRWNWDLGSKHWDWYRESLKNVCKDTTEKMENMDEEFTAQRTNKRNRSQWKEKINTLVDDFTNEIHRCAHATIGTRQHYNGYKPWWNKEIACLKKLCKRESRKKHRYERIGREKGRSDNEIRRDQRWIDLHHGHKYLLKSKQGEIRKAKKKATARLNKQLQNPKTNNKTLYQTLNNKKYRIFNKIPPLFVDHTQTTTTSDPNKKAELIHDHISNPPQPPATNAQSIEHHRIEDTADLIIQSDECISPHITDNATDLFNSGIQYYESRNCIAELLNDKAQGPDRIHNLLISNAGEDFIHCVTRLFNLLFKYHVFPDVWNKAHIIPIPKPNKDHRKAANYRPIAISSCLGRVYERIISKRLQTFCVQTKIFNNNQTGFQINRSTDDMLSVFLNDAYECLDKASDLDAVFTDFSKAYDTIWHRGLIHKLQHKYNINGNLLHMIIAFLLGRQTRVLSQDGSSEWRRQLIGVPQGSPLSPLLYIIYTNDYKISITNRNYVSIGLFADDTILWTVPHLKEPLRYKLLQKELNHFYEWCCDWKLTLNPTKCFTMTITKTKELCYKMVPRDSCPHCNRVALDTNICSIEQHDMSPIKTPNHRRYHINGKILDIVHTFKYLGLVIDDNLCFKHHEHRVLQKMQKQYNHLYFLTITGITLHPKSIIALYKQKSRAYIEYAAPFWYHYASDDVQRMQSKYLRLAVPCKRSTPIDLLHNLQQVEPVHHRVNTLRCRLWLRSIYSSKFHPLQRTQQRVNTITKQMSNGLWRQYRPKANSYYYHKSPLYNAMITFNDIEPHFAYPVPNDPPNNPITALPNYLISHFPSNYTTITTNSVPESYPEWYHIFTDGSCHPNPGIGAYGWYDINTDESNAIDWKVITSILAMELEAVILILHHITLHPPAAPQIAIFVDNLTVIKLLEFSSYPKYNCTRMLVQNALQTLANIEHQHPTIHIKFIKIKSHAGHEGNKRIDKIVSDMTAVARYDLSQAHKVTFPSALSMVIRHNKSQQYNEWKTRPNRLTLCYRTNPSWNSKLQKLFAVLNRSDASIMIQVISEHINLNTYYHRMQYDPASNDTETHMNTPQIEEKKSGDEDDSDDSDDINLLFTQGHQDRHHHMIQHNITQIPSIPSSCKLCDSNTDEDLNHFVMKCNAFETQRNDLKRELAAIYRRFLFTKVFTLENIVYPYKIRRLPRHKQHRIWNALITYIRKTKRLRYDLIKSSDHELNPQQYQHDNDIEMHRIDEKNDGNSLANNISYPWNPG